jgi:hypothetical protein
MNPPTRMSQPIEPAAVVAEGEKMIFDQVDYQRRLSDEYRMLQDKIDKIGAFRFTIKGWSVTGVGAVSAAASAITGPQTALAVSLALVVMVTFFFLLEVEQVRLSRLFGARARTLEGIFGAIDRGKALGLPPPVPYTAHEIAKVSYQRVLANRRQPARLRFSSSVKESWEVGRSAHRWFYFVLVLLAMVPAVRYSPDIVASISQRALKLEGYASHAIRTTFGQTKGGN